MSLLECPICRTEVKQLVIPPDGKKYGCRSCVYEGASRGKSYNVNLGQTSDKWRGSDGKLHRITVGKQIEIEGRRLTPEGKMISKDNGNKEARY